MIFSNHSRRGLVPIATIIIGLLVLVGGYFALERIAKNLPGDDSLTEDDLDGLKLVRAALNLTYDLNLTLTDLDTSGEVSRLQIFLKQEGYLSESEVTGVYDDRTQVAVQEFQSEQEIVKSGTAETTGYGAVGPKTREVIARVSSEPEPVNVIVEPTQTSSPEPTQTSSPEPTKPFLHVIYPNGGEKFTTDGRLRIGWDWHAVGNIKIQICTDQTSPRLGYVCKDIADRLNSDLGSYVWKIDPNHPYFPSDRLKIKIVSIDDDTSGLSDESDRFFSIRDPYVPIVVSPNGGEEWERGSTQKIAWRDRSEDPAGDKSNVRIFLFEWAGTVLCDVDGGGCSGRLGRFYTITDSTPNSGGYGWGVGKVSSGEYIKDGLYGIRVLDLNTGQYDDSDREFRVFTKQSQKPAFIDSIQSKANPVGTVDSGGRAFIYGKGLSGNLTVQLGRKEPKYLRTTGTSDTFAEFTVPEWSQSAEVSVTVTNSSDQESNFYEVKINVPEKPVVFRLESPNGGEKWAIDSKQTIAWKHRATEATGSLYLFTWDKVCTQIVPSTCRDVPGEMRLINGKVSLTGEKYWDGTANYSWDVGRLADGSKISFGRSDSGSYGIRIKNNHTGEFDDSDFLFTITGSQTDSVGLKISSPNGGERWEMGSVKNAIRWSGGTIEKGLLRLELIDWRESCRTDNPCSLKPIRIQTISSGTENDGIFEWTVGKLENRTFTNSGKYIIRISENANRQMFDESDSPFEIVGESPIQPAFIDSIQSKANPVGTVDSGGRAFIYGTGLSGDLTVQLGRKEPKYLRTTGTSDTFAEFTVPEWSQSAVVSVTVTNSSGQESNFYEVKINVPVTFQITSPKGGDSLTINTNFPVRWSTTGIPSSARAYIDMVGSGITYRVAQDIENTGEHSLLVGHEVNGRELPEGAYSMKVCAFLDGTPHCDIIGPINITRKG